LIKCRLPIPEFYQLYSRYTDERVNNFPEIKATLPFGQLPVLTYKGTVIAQSLTMARSVAENVCLYAKPGRDAFSLQLDLKMAMPAPIYNGTLESFA